MLCAMLPLTTLATPSVTSTKSATNTSASDDSWITDPSIQVILSKPPPSAINANSFKVWDWMWESICVGLGANAYKAYFISEAYEKDMHIRFPQWVDNFERVIHTQAEWDDWVREKQYEKRYKGSKKFWESD
ncbi:hypothetical protein BLS_006723 [Venturia inaequalis]|nr:hypothetical protein BLS_006723 [Venturia inaequalis]